MPSIGRIGRVVAVAPAAADVPVTDPGAVLDEVEEGHRVAAVDTCPTVPS
jgi:hypothetical protein